MCQNIVNLQSFKSFTALSAILSFICRASVKENGASTAEKPHFLIDLFSIGKQGRIQEKILGVDFW